MVAAVDDQFFACDEGPGSIRRQQEGGTDEFTGLTESFHGGMTHDTGDAVGGEHLLVLLGREKTGDEDVNAHLGGSPLAGKVEGKIVHGALGGRVGEYARERHNAGHRTEIDDRAPLPLLDQVLTENLAAEKYAFEINVNNPVELFLSDI